MTKNQRLIALGVIVLLLLTFGFLRYQSYMKNEYARVAKENAGLTAQMKTYVDENGTLHSQIETFKVDKKAYEATHKQELDSVANLLDIKTKNITSLTNVVAYYQGRISTRVDTTYKYDTTIVEGKPRIDTVRILNFPYQDRWMTFKGQLINQDFTADYSITDSLTYVTFTKRTGFLGLGAKKNYLDISGTNPNLKITNMKSVELTKLREKPWSFGPYVGYGFDGQRWRPSVGFSIQRTLFRF